MEGFTASLRQGLGPQQRVQWYSLEPGERELLRTLKWICLLSLPVLATACGNGALWERQAEHLNQMPVTSLQVRGEPGRAFAVRLAANERDRALGFQHVPRRQLEAEAILFQFESPHRTTFHMRNVQAPLLIAWIDVRGEVIEVAEMRPGGALYPSPGEIIAALEYSPRHRLADVIVPGDRLTWRQPEVEE